MVNFLDLSASSEEERRLIREILSDTSVVNIAQPTPTATKPISPAKTKTYPFGSVATTLVNSQQSAAPDIRRTNQNSSDTVAPASTVASDTLVQGNAKAHTSPSQLSHQRPPPKQAPVANFISSRDHPKQQQLKHHQNSSNVGSSADTLDGNVSLATISSAPILPTTAATKQPESTNLGVKSQKHEPTAQNAHSIPSSHDGSESQVLNHIDDVKGTGNVACNTSVIETATTCAEPLNRQPQMASITTQATNSHHHQHIVGQRQLFKGPYNQHVNFSNNASNSHTTSSLACSHAVPAGPKNNYNNQRKSMHNINSTNGGVVNSGNVTRNTRPPNIGNAVGGANHPQARYSQQYAPPQQSGPLPNYHNMNVNNQSANPLNSQLNQQRTNEHSNDRLRVAMNNNMNANNDVKIAPTSVSNMSPLGHGIDPHHGNTMSMNIYNHPTSHMQHQVPPVMSTAKLDPKNVGLKNQSYHSQDTSNLHSSSPGAQSVPQSAQMPPMAGDMNSVIGMDMSSSQPTGYAMPPHVTTFGPPPHVYGGPPIFQPYHYLIPYNMHPPYVPFVLSSNSVIHPRQQVPPQANQPPNASGSSNSSHSRSLSHQTSHQGAELYGSHQVNQRQSANEEATTVQGISPHDDQSTALESHMPAKVTTIHKSAGPTSKTTPEDPKTDHSNSQDKIIVNRMRRESQDCELPPTNDLGVNHRQDVIERGATGNNMSCKLGSKTSSVDQSKASRAMPTDSKSTVSVIRGERDGLPAKKPSQEPTPSHKSSDLQTRTGNFDVQGSSRPNSFPASRTNGEDTVKLSSDEGFDTQSSLDVSKQSQGSSTTSNQSSPQNSLKPTAEKTVNDARESSEAKRTETLKNSSGGAWNSTASKSWADLFKRGGNPHTQSTNGEIDQEHHSGSENAGDDNRARKSVPNRNEIKVNSLTSAPKELRSQDAAKRAQDKMASRLAHKINSINLKHSLPFLKPRGFINKGNGCYINATLQALIACPPFYNLMKEVGDLKIHRRENSCTPILDSFAELFLNFLPLDANKKMKQPTPAPDQRLNINHLQAEAIEPKCIYSVLGQIKSECLKGAQEDAEEFLSSVLNGLHEEMIGLGEVLNEQTVHNGHSSDLEDSNDDVANDDNLWREVGSKNRSLPIRTAKVVNTPIQEIFGGSLFSIRTAGKDRCGHRSPFFDLQLDISSDNVKSVQDAIKSFTATEIIQDFYCSRTKQKLDAQRRTSLDQLPPILILHLKQFVYTQDQGLKKLIKKIEYPIDFEIPDGCLHEKTFSDKGFKTSKTYKLLAVVYHDGKEAVKGHYLTDVYHIGSSHWIRCDDSNLKVISSPRIETPDSTRTPYLLFYRRLNTLRAQSSNHDNKRKS